ncbi:hypothetical protein GW916_15335 [bacterium]|nr:hypothetical protein [bacterium]
MTFDASSAGKAIKALRRTRRDVWLVRAVALVISIILWMAVLGGEQVEVTKNFSFDYQLPEHLMIANAAPREMSFRVSGPQAFIKDFETRKITRSIDLTKAQQGEYEVSISEELLDLPLGLHLISAPQEKIVVKLGRAAWKRVPIRAVFENKLPEGFRVTNITLSPSTLEIRGPESRLRSIDTLATEGIVLASDSLVQEFDVKLGLKDYPGVILDEQNSVVHVTVQIEGSLARSSITDIPVRVRVVGGAGARTVNLRKTGINVTPSKVNFMFEGPADVMKTLRRGDIDVWAEVSELKEGIQRVRLDWGLPPKVRVVKRSTDWVELEIPRR